MFSCTGKRVQAIKLLLVLALLLKESGAILFFRFVVAIVVLN